MKTPQIKLLREYKKDYPLNYTSDTRSAQAWFGVDENNPVVWVKYALRSKSGKVELWTIETKPEFRNQGLSKQALETLKEHFGVEHIYHSGGYTPEGFKYISHQVEWIPEFTEHPEENFRSMDFVEEWNINHNY